MASSRKHGTHSTVHLTLPLIAAGAASDGAAVDVFTYEAFAGSSATASGGGGLSAEQEWLLELAISTAAILTGQATNFSSIRVSHYSAAGVLKNQIRVDFNAAGVVTAAFVPLNYAVPSAAVVPGAGTGTLNVVSGSALPWPLANGDQIVLDRLSTGTGLQTPALAATGKIGVKS